MTSELKAEARKMWVLAAATLERDVLLHGMTQDEQDVMIEAVLNAAMRLPNPEGMTALSFAWTATSDYKHYPPYVNLTGNRLAVRGTEEFKGDYYEEGPYAEVDLPPEAIVELRAALSTRSEGQVTEAHHAELVEALNDALCILVHYDAYIRYQVKADDLERHPYLPEVESVLETANALLAKIGEGQ
jgi:hypothetical protein